MSDSWIRANPSTDEPSNQTPSSRAASSPLTGKSMLFTAPATSENCKDRNLILPSCACLTNSLASILTPLSLRSTRQYYYETNIFEALDNTSCRIFRDPQPKIFATKRVNNGIRPQPVFYLDIATTMALISGVLLAKNPTGGKFPSLHRSSELKWK